VPLIVVAEGVLVLQLFDEAHADLERLIALLVGRYVSRVDDIY
jgi:hypothetical protein